MLWYFGCLVFWSLSIDGGIDDGGCDVRIVVVVVGRRIRSSSEYLYIFNPLTWQKLFHRWEWTYSSVLRSSGMLRHVKWETVTGGLEKCFDSTFLIKHSKRVLYSGWTLWPRMWRHYSTPKCPLPFPSQRGMTFQNTWVPINPSVRNP